jgi:hypothetical protein
MNQLGTLNYWGAAILAIATFGNTSASPIRSLLQAPISTPTDSSLSQPSAEIPLQLLNPLSSGHAATWTGQVEHYMLNVDGIVEGLILSNGIQMRFPPHMSGLLVTSIQPGDTVLIEGTDGSGTEFGQEVRATRVTNLHTGETIAEQPPGTTGNQVLTTTTYDEFSVSGSADHWLVGHQGEIRGIVLTTGIQIRFSPDVSDQLYAIAKTGVTIEAAGFGSQNNFGQVIEATSLVVDGQPIALDARQPYRAHLRS